MTGRRRAGGRPGHAIAAGHGASERTRGGGPGRRAARPATPRPVVCAILTASDSRRGALDRSGDAIERLLTRAGHRVAVRAWTPDDVAAIRRVARAALARSDVDTLIVTGGTGVSPRDRTPEALERLIERWLPGFGEVFRAFSLRQVGTAAWLSRAAAGVARGRLVVLLPGSTAAVDLALRSVLLPELVHVVRMLGRFEGEE